MRIASVFPQAVSAIEIPDHRLALLGHLDHYGLGYEQEAGKVLVKENGETVLAATFDELNRLTNLEVQVHADQR